MSKKFDADQTENDLGALLELRELIASELDPIGTQNQTDRALKPLTDGLGLDSPKEALVPSPPKSISANDGVKERLETARVVPGASALSPRVSHEVPNATPQTLDLRRRIEPREKGLAEVIAPKPEREERAALEETPAREFVSDQDLAPIPPPLPKTSLVRRMMSGLLDLIFVNSLFVLSFGLTLKLMSNGGPFNLDQVKTMDSQQMIRFAVLEYSTLWLAYFAIGLGVLDATFGMWVWGLRLNYPRESLGSILWKKSRRILASVVFFTGLAPLVLLVFRTRGKNLLDLLSGTTVYRTLG